MPYFLASMCRLPSHKPSLSSEGQICSLFEYRKQEGKDDNRDEARKAVDEWTVIEESRIPRTVPEIWRRKGAVRHADYSAT
jgi:hypothetical protein